MASTIVCPSCSYKNSLPLPNDRCVSCGAHVEAPASRGLTAEDMERRYRQDGFNLLWFAIAVVVEAVLTTALVFGLPTVVPLLDFEGQAGMGVALPVWFVGGMLVGLISPGRTFVEPVVAAFLVAIPTAYWLHANQVVKTMPWWMYVLMCALGILFTLVGSYIGERIQMGPPPKTVE